MNSHHDVMCNSALNLRSKFKNLPNSFNKSSENIGSLLDEIIADIDYLTVIFNMELPFLLSIADKLPEKKPAFIVTLDSLKERIERVCRNNEIRKEEIKHIYEELKLILEAYQNSYHFDIEEFKKTVRVAMKDKDWPGIKKFWCDHLVMKDFVNEVAAENSFELAKSLLNQIDVVINSLTLIKDIIDQLEDNISTIIKLRLKQIEANWSLISENIALFKQEPKYWEGC